MKFQQLNQIDVNDHTEKKGRFTYLSWPFAWAEIKKVDPSANYVVYSSDNGKPYFECGSAGAFVKVGVTVNGVEHIENFPVLNHKNVAIPCEKLTVFDVNTSIKRGMVKAIAMHGLGLYIYAGEDLPIDSSTPKKKKVNPVKINNVPF